MTRALVPVLLLALLLATPALAAKPAAAPAPALRIASVNLAVLYALHPDVQYYIPEQGRFLNADATTDFTKRAADHAEKISATTKKIGETRALLDRTEDRRREAQLDHYTKRQRILSDMQSERDNPANRGKTFDFSKEEAKLKEVDAAFERTLAAIEADRVAALAEAEKLNDELKAINYHVGPAHEKKVQAVVDDVAAAVRTAAEKHGVQVVLNSAQFHRALAASAPEAGTRVQAYDPAAQAASMSMYEKDSGVGELIDAHGGVSGARGYLDYRLADYADWMKESPRYTEPFRAANLNDLIVGGGDDLDLTADALADILARHGVEKDVIDLVTVGVRTKKIY